MVNYKCLTCGKEFNRKSNFLTHTENKKKPCKPLVTEKYSKNSEIFQNILGYSEIFQNIPKIPETTGNNNKIDQESDNSTNKSIKNEEPNENLCKYCFKQFSTTFNLNKHIKNNCKVKKLNDEKKDEIFNRLLENESKVNNIISNFENLQKENEKLKQYIRDLENKYNGDIKKIVNKNTNNTINNTNNNNLNIIIPNDKLVDFGKEDLSKIPYEDIIKSCSGSNVTGYHVLIELIKQIHFNDKFPEFQNVYMTDRNRERYMYWQNAWQLGDNNIFTEIMSQPQELLSTHEEKLEKDIENNKTTAKKINGVVDRYYECDKGFNEVVDPKVKDLIYNNRDKIRNNYKKLVKETESNNLITK